ncbi:MAG: hypothetical protein ACLQED_12165 [Desulfobaccales bacterium]
MNIKKLAFIGIIILSISSPAVAFKPGSEPDGFRGIKWGTDISTLNDMVYAGTESSEVITYIRKGDVLKIGMANVVKIKYYFYKGKFFEVFIVTAGLRNWQALKEACFDKYGGAYKRYDYEEYYLWGLGKITIMAIGYNAVTEGGHLIMRSREISKEVELFEKKESQKPKAVEGF